MSSPIRVVLADDQQLVRAGFRMVIDSQPDLVVVGEAGDGAAAVELVRRTPADVAAEGYPTPITAASPAAAKTANRSPASAPPAHEITTAAGRTR